MTYQQPVYADPYYNVEPALRYVCNTCGVLVADQSNHTAWHRTMNAVIADHDGHALRSVVTKMVDPSILNTNDVAHVPTYRGMEPLTEEEQEAVERAFKRLGIPY